MRRCKHCKSLNVIHVRLDRDWADGAGDMNLVNPRECYSLRNLIDDFEEDNEAAGHPDIHIDYCLDCHAQSSFLTEEVEDDGSCRGQVRE